MQFIRHHIDVVEKGVSFFAHAGTQHDEYLRQKLFDDAEWRIDNLPSGQYNEVDD